MKSMDEDIQNLQLDRPGRGKTVEQIKKHTVDSQFENKPIERSVFLLTKGDDIQKISVIQDLPQLMQTEPQATYARIIPKILQELPNSSCEFHLMTSKVFRLLMERQVPVNLLHAVLQGIESRDPIVANSWMETLLAVISVLSESQLKSEIIPLANNKSLLTQPIAARIASCRILGRLAVHKAFEAMDVKRDILPLVQSLCQDCHPDVRTAMCVQLPSIAQGLGTALVKGNLLTSLVELAADDNMYVRSASVSATVQIFPYTSLDVKKQTILPLVKQLCEKSLKSDDATCTTVAKEIGKLVEGLQVVLGINETMWFLHCYKTLAHRGLSSDMSAFRSADTSLDVMCRQHCASNLPTISLFILSVVPGQADLLYSIFRDLAADPCYMVRRTVAGCLHEIVKTFGSQSKMMKPDLVRLLRDDSEDVLQMLVPQMGTTLELFCTYGTLSRQISNVSTVEIGRAMLKCQFELASGYNWRLLTHFIHQLEHLPNCMPPDFIHQHFTPVVLTSAVQGRAKPVRSQAVRTLLVFLRYNSKDMQRRWLKDNLVSQLCHSKCSYTRHIFIRLCANAIDIFSEKYFKEYFYEYLLDLADDPVANIRLCVANLFAILKQMLVLPEDQALSNRLTDVFNKFRNEEKDKDVIAVFKSKMEEIRNPSPEFTSDEHVKEQKRRLEEEEKIASTGKGSIYVLGKKGPGNRTPSRPNSLKQHSSSNEMPLGKPNSTTQPRSFSVPPRGGSSNTSPSNDMSFLEQHFYIDAGINLPTKSINKEPKTVGKLANSFSNDTQVVASASDDFSSKPENEAVNLLDSINITDDDKVNLRKLSNHKTHSNNKNKRYSSVLSATCLEKNQEQKVMNRRSLTITPKEISKIPVSSKICVRKERSFGEINLRSCKVGAETIQSKGDDSKDDNGNNEETSISVSNNGAKSKIVDDNDSSISSSKSNLLSLESNNDVSQSSYRSPSQLPILKRRSQSEVRKLY